MSRAFSTDHLAIPGTLCQAVCKYHSIGVIDGVPNCSTETKREGLLTKKERVMVAQIVQARDQRRNGIT